MGHMMLAARVMQKLCTVQKQCSWSGQRSEVWSSTTGSQELCQDDVPASRLRHKMLRGVYCD